MNPEIMPLPFLLLIVIFLGIMAMAAVFLAALLFRVMREVQRATVTLNDTSRAIINASQQLSTLAAAVSTKLEQSEDVLVTFQQAGDLFFMTAKETKGALTPLFDQIAGLANALQPKTASPGDNSPAPEKPA